MKKEFDHLFSEKFFYLLACDFAHAADSLEQIADFGDRVWKEEMAKLNLKQGEGFKKHTPTTREHTASCDRRLRAISVYLFAHSLELLIKILHLDSFKKIEYSHKISSLFNDIKDKYAFSTKFNIDNLNELLLKLDALLIWAGRYGVPKKTTALGDSVESFAKIFSQEGGATAYTNDIVTAVDNISSFNGIKLLKDLILFVREQTKFHKNNFREK